MPLNRYVTAAPTFTDLAQYKHLKMFENSRNTSGLESAPFVFFGTFAPQDLNALVSFNFASPSYALVSSASKPLYLNGPLHLNGDDYAGDTSTTGLLLASGSTITGEIEIARDEDWFRIELEVDQGILITISSQTAELQYMTIGIHQEDGDFGDYRTNRNGPVQGAFSPHIDTYTSGTYYIGFRGAFEQTGHYTITVSSISDDYSYTPETSGTLIVGGGPTTGQSNFDNDVDWFEFNVTAGDEVEFLLSFNGFSGPAHGDIFDANRNHIASFQSTGVNGEVSVTLIMNTDGPFYVEIISRLPDTLTPQTYTLNAVLLSSGNPVTTDQSSTFTRTGTLQLDAPTYDEAIDIEGDIDVYDFDAVADQNVYFELTMLLAGLIITIHDENGDVLQTTPFLDASQSIIITFTPSKTGVYFIRVAGEIVEDLGDYSIRMFSQSPFNIATEGNDELHGTENADTISALAGNDTLYGGAGDDYLNGGTGDDSLYGEAGQDLFIIGANAGNDQIMDFEDGIDHIQMLGDIYSFNQLKIYQDGNNVIVASANGVTTLMDTNIADIDASDFVFTVSEEFLSVESLNAPITPTPHSADPLSQGEITGTSGDDTIMGGEFSDFIYGLGGNDTLHGLDGDDYLVGGEGDDILYGGDGDDELEGGEGADTLDGGAGEDIISYIESTVGVAINLATGTAFSGDAIGDTFTNFENVFGSLAGNNAITGDNQANHIYAYGGNNFIDGGGGNDIIETTGDNNIVNGGAGNDRILGNDGDFGGSDLINGGEGDDVLGGGKGIDTVILNGTSIDDYTITEITNGFLVIDNVGNDGADKLYNIEYLRINGEDIPLSAIIEEPEPVERTIDGIANYLTDEFTTRSTYDITEITYDVSGLSTGAQALAIRALQAWADVANLTFTAAATDAHIVFTNEGNTASTVNDTTSGTINGSEINLGAGWNNGILDLDSYTYQTFLHEIGHALGLGHAGPYNRRAIYNIHNVYENDSWAYTLMSYFDQDESGYFGDLRFVLGPQIADILAIQNLYGANTTTRNGDTVYGFNSTETDVHNFAQFTRAPSLSIYDTSGIDTFDFSNYAQDQNISLIAETFSSINGIIGAISIARNTIIENAIGGSGNDILTGNSADNILTGNTGDDVFISSAGNDTINGGNGIDTLNYTQYERGITVDLVAGTMSDNNGTTSTISGIENLLGTSQFDDALHGSAESNNLYGQGGNDTLQGGGGNDRLYGGTGDDILYGNAGADMFAIEANAGNDQIMDFEDGIDHIEFIDALYSFAQLKIYQDGANVIVASDNGVTTLMNTNIADIDASDFIFRVSADADKSQAFDQEQFVEFLFTTSGLSTALAETDNEMGFDMTTPDDSSHFDMV